MSSIPLVATTIQQPQSPLDNALKAASLRDMVQRGQLEQGQGQLQQQQIQQGQIALQDQKAIGQAQQQAYQNWDGKDFRDLNNQTLKLSIQNGASPTAVSAIQQHLVQQQLQYSEMAKNDAQTGQANIDTAIKKNDVTVGQLNALKALPDGQIAQALPQTMAQMAQQGLLDPKVAQTAPQVAQGTPDQIRTELDNLSKHYMSQSQQAKAAQDAADLAAKKAQLPGQVADSQIKQAEAGAMQQYGGLNQNMADSKYRFLEQQKNLGKPVGSDDAAFMKAYERQKTLNTQFQFNLQNAGAQGQGGQPSAIAQAIANGSMKWQDAISPRTPMSVKAQMLSEVKQLNPNFNSGDFDVEKKVKEAFTSGNYSQQLNAINTARQHMQTFGQLADALNNGDVQAANSIGNALGVQFGSDRATNFKIAAQAFGGEVGKAFDGAGVTQSERESASGAFNPNMSPAQLKGAVRTVDSLLQGKQNALKSTFQQGTQAKPNFGTQQETTQPGAFNWDAHPKVNQ